jgi:hypothetical protein
MKNSELIILVVVSASISLLLSQEEAYAMKDSGWGDARDFWRMLNGVENYYGKYFAEDDFDNESFKDFELTVKIVSYEKKTPSLVVSTNGEEKVISSHALKDGSEKVRFFLDMDDLDSTKEKVSIKVKGKQFEITKQFKTNSKENKATVEFYYREGGKQR